MRYYYAFAWAWVIMVGGLMFTPGGWSCPRCGVFELPIAGITVALGVVGLVTTLRAPRLAGA